MQPQESESNVSLHLQCLVCQLQQGVEAVEACTLRDTGPQLPSLPLQG